MVLVLLLLPTLVSAAASTPESDIELHARFVENDKQLRSSMDEFFAKADHETEVPEAQCVEILRPVLVNMPTVIFPIIAQYGMPALAVQPGIPDIFTRVWTDSWGEKFSSLDVQSTNLQVDYGQRYPDELIDVCDIDRLRIENSLKSRLLLHTQGYWQQYDGQVDPICVLQCFYSVNAAKRAIGLLATKISESQPLSQTAIAAKS